MQLPWVSRRKLEVAEARCAALTADLAASEAKRLAELKGHNASEMRLSQAVDSVEAERRLLTDRLFALLGQPPIYSKPEPPTVPAAASANDGPPVPRRLTFEAVHAEARKAIADGSFSLNPRRPN